MDPSATYHHGKDRDRHTEAEAMAEGGALIRRHVQESRGSQDGGGQTQHIQYQPPTPNPQDEIAALEECKKDLGEEKASIEQEINDIETNLKELKSKLESEKKEPTDQ